VNTNKTKVQNDGTLGNLPESEIDTWDGADVMGGVRSRRKLSRVTGVVAQKKFLSRQISRQFYHLDGPSKPSKPRAASFLWSAVT
jgi:hypothetical protein